MQEAFIEVKLVGGSTALVPLSNISHIVSGDSLARCDIHLRSRERPLNADRGMATINVLISSALRAGLVEGEVRG